MKYLLKNAETEKAKIVYAFQWDFQGFGNGPINRVYKNGDKWEFTGVEAYDRGREYSIDVDEELIIIALHYVENNDVLEHLILGEVITFHRGNEGGVLATGYTYTGETTGTKGVVMHKPNPNGIGKGTWLNYTEPNGGAQPDPTDGYPVYGGNLMAWKVDIFEVGHTYDDFLTSVYPGVTSKEEGGVAFNPFESADVEVKFIYLDENGDETLLNYSTDVCMPECLCYDHPSVAGAREACYNLALQGNYTKFHPAGTFNIYVKVFTNDKFSDEDLRSMNLTFYDIDECGCNPNIDAYGLDESTNLVLNNENGDVFYEILPGTKKVTVLYIAAQGVAD